MSAGDISTLGDTMSTQEAYYDESGGYHEHTGEMFSTPWFPYKFNAFMNDLTQVNRRVLMISSPPV